MTTTRLEAASLGNRAARTALGLTDRTLATLDGKLSRLRLRLRAWKVALDPGTERRAREVHSTNWAEPGVPDARELVERWLEP